MAIVAGTVAVRAAALYNVDDHMMCMEVVVVEVDCTCNVGKLEMELVKDAAINAAVVKDVTIDFCRQYFHSVLLFLFFGGAP